MLEIEKFTRKTFDVDAVEVKEDNIEEVAKWCTGEIRTAVDKNGSKKYVKVWVHRAMNERQTKAFVGDFVLYAGTGFKVYTAKAFEKSFQKVTPLAEAVEAYGNAVDVPDHLAVE